MKRIAAVLWLSALLGGCALTEDSIPVNYAAPSSISVVPGAKNVTLNVIPVDGRISNRDRVSTKKNGYGMEMAKIVASNDVVAEVGSAVQAELASLGFNIGRGGVDVTVETVNFYNDFKPGFWSAEAVAEVAFNLTAKTADGSLVYSRNYRALGMGKDVILASGSEAQGPLVEALRNAVQQVVTDTALHEALVRAGRSPQGKQSRPNMPTS
ncbi:YajG family lipoprotein [Azospirillum sp. A39]|uniref:YajG family lipoprotein n=1 Tax=Azospirillum sp. A39 TaxID=3462279 RepID=UPI00404662F9